ncbi:MAG TPA: DUF3052 domain-containing protein [Actinomycetes bacterium]|nr:DUF3052 domain-containing protein [Actinomycetes bacterium]
MSTPAASSSQRENLPVMVGYSGTPLARKLGIKPDDRVLVSGRPRDLDFAALVAPLPDGAAIVSRRAKSSPMVICFAESVAELEKRLPDAINSIPRSGTIWVCWPKKSSARFKAGTRDLTEDSIRALALELGVVDVKVCAVDDTWSGLKLVYRLADR